LNRVGDEAPIILVVGEQTLPILENTKPDTPPHNQINKRTSVKSEQT
jgi:hypothetical protein